MILRYYTAGDSHGPGLLGILEGLPAGLPLTLDDVDRDLDRRQRGFGRSNRQRHRDNAEIWGGLHQGRTTGAPLGIRLRNPGEADALDLLPPIRIPRPGHADLAGAMKYGLNDVRAIWERASARETAMRTALGAAARRLLAEAGIFVISRVRRIGAVVSGSTSGEHLTSPAEIQAIADAAEASEVRCDDPVATAGMIREIEAARAARDSLGGVAEILVAPLPVGLGSHVHWDRRLDGRLAQAAMSVPSVKAMEIGAGVEGAMELGSRLHDGIFRGSRGILRRTNRAGGLEGGMTNGMPLVLRVHFKPIPTLGEGLPSVDLETGEETTTDPLRADICAVPAGGVVVEAVVALVLADALLERTGGDTLEMVLAALERTR
ncbi:MAG: chorismate synthase [Pseudomonadota bacterium]